MGEDHGRCEELGTAAPKNLSGNGKRHVFEGVLLSSKNEHEEKKVTYIANIFSNSVFFRFHLERLTMS